VLHAYTSAPARLGTAGLLFTLVSPHLQAGPFSSLDACEVFTLEARLRCVQLQVGAHGGVVQACAACHAHAPLGLHAAPVAPGVHVFWPQVKLFGGCCQAVEQAPTQDLIPDAWLLGLLWRMAGLVLGKLGGQRC
jgi:hypothetical protein